MQEAYNQTVIDHFLNPRNSGGLDEPDGVAQVGDPDCGDTLKLFIKVRDDVITEASFQVKGCAAAIASASMTTELLKGRTPEEALRLTDNDVIEALGGLPPAKAHCSMMAEQAVVAVIRDYRERLSAMYAGIDYSYPFLQDLCSQCTCGVVENE